MDPKAPVPWDALEAVRGEPQLRAVFDAHREEVADAESAEAAVDRLERVRRDQYDVASPDQGTAFVFAYLAETELGMSVDPPGDLPSLAARKPDDDTLERLFWDEEQVPWWTAVRCGVHYTLVIYWLWEADVPLMRRNIPDHQFAQIDLDD